MTQVRLQSVWAAVTALAAWLLGLFRRPRARPEPSGVREPRRPRPTLPGGAIALAEPRVDIRRRIRLIGRRDSRTI
jgi:hypothetical protein